MRGGDVTIGGYVAGVFRTGRRGAGVIWGVDMLSTLHAAVLGLAAGLSWSRGARGLAYAFGAVVLLSLAEGWPFGDVAHVLAAGVCLAGICWDCRNTGAASSLKGACVAAVILVIVGPWLGRVGTGVYLAACYLTAAVIGGFAARGVYRRPAGIVAASCATGAAGSTLWAMGYTITPAVCADIVLSLIFCAVVTRPTTR